MAHWSDDAERARLAADIEARIRDLDMVEVLRSEGREWAWVADDDGNPYRIPLHPPAVERP